MFKKSQAIFHIDGFSYNKDLSMKLSAALIKVKIIAILSLLYNIYTYIEYFLFWFSSYVWAERREMCVCCMFYCGCIGIIDAIRYLLGEKKYINDKSALYQGN